MSSARSGFIVHSWLIEAGDSHAMISYHPYHNTEAFQIRDTLVNGGFRVWISSAKKDKSIEKASLSDGPNDGQQDHVAKCQVFIICFSTAYKTSEYCKTEALRAVMLNKPVILVRVEPGCEIDGWLSLAMSGATADSPLIDLAKPDGCQNILATLTVMIDKLAGNDITEEEKPKTPSQMEAEIKRKGKELLIAAQIGDAGRVRKIVESVHEGQWRHALLEVHSEDPNFYMDTPFLRAARCGRVEAAEELMKLGANIHAHNKLHNNALHLAAGYGQQLMIKMLLDLGHLKIDEKGQWGRTPLHHAAAENSLGAVKILIHRGAHIEAKGGHFERTPLGMAAHFGRNDIVDFLCESGAKVDAADADGETIIHLAATTGKTDTARLLIKRWNCDPEAKDNDNWTPLLTAASEGHEEFVLMLLKEANADIFAHSVPEGHNVIHVAAEFGRGNIIRAVLNFAKKEGYNIPGGYAMNPVDRLLNGQNRNGETPLHVACAHSQLLSVEALLEWGASTELRNKDNMTPLALARDADFDRTNEKAVEAIVEVLRSHGAPEL